MLCCVCVTSNLDLFSDHDECLSCIKATIHCAMLYTYIHFTLTYYTTYTKTYQTYYITYNAFIFNIDIDITLVIFIGSWTESKAYCIYNINSCQPITVAVTITITVTEAQIKIKKLWLWIKGLKSVNWYWPEPVIHHGSFNTQYHLFKCWRQKVMFKGSINTFEMDIGIMEVLQIILYEILHPALCSSGFFFSSLLLLLPHELLPPRRDILIQGINKPLSSILIDI